MSTSAPDAIDAILGSSAPPVAALRERRPVTREQSQATYDALFSPIDDAHFSRAERALVAAFATRLSGDTLSARHYGELARAVAPELAETVLAEASAAATTGPFGHYVEPGLAAENTEGERYAAPGSVDPRLAAALAHTHALTFRPREARDEAIQALLDAGWDTDGIVTLSQLVAFLAFQQRVVEGLRVLSQEVSA